MPKRINYRTIILTAVAVILTALFIWHAVSMSFTQDDAFISYRYVKNFLGGSGLVFNPGEYVEGYTNFLFIVLMILVGALGGNYIIFSKLLGVSSGVAILIISFLWLSQIAKEKNGISPIAVPLLLLANSAFAYWAISGLETLFFSALVLWGLYLAERKNIFFALVLGLATLTRPEGGLIFAAIIGYFLFTRAVSIRSLIKYIIVYSLLILPQLIFRIWYYHDILPNPFYAKTGLSTEYIIAGGGYIIHFLKQYGFYGILLLFPILNIRQLAREFGLGLFVSIIFMVYIIFIGGDVLHGHRFMIPILPLLYILFALSLINLSRKLFASRAILANTINAFLLIGATAATFWVARPELTNIRRQEIGLIDKMSTCAKIINESGLKNLTVACPTIGAFGYFGDVVVIDMLGLTDRTIAKNPRPVTGIVSTWKERNYNAPYIMSRNPDLILFSTEIKPSAPAEKALFLSSRFRQGYYPIYVGKSNDWTIFKKNPEKTVVDEYIADPKFVNLYASALNSFDDQKFYDAYQDVSKSNQICPPDFYMPKILMAQISIVWGNSLDAVPLLQEAYKISDGYSIAAGSLLVQYNKAIGDTAKAAAYSKKLATYNRIGK
jgi:arabinofuranosyltransferase